MRSRMLLFLRRNVVRDVFQMGGLTTLAQLFPLLAAPILARIYTPAEFGAYTVFISLISFFWMVGGARYEQAIVISDTDEEASYVAGIAQFFTLIFCGIWILSTFIFSDFWLKMTDFTLSLFWIQMTALSIYFASTSDQLMGLLNRFQKYKNIAGARITANFMQVVGHVGLGISGFTSIGLMVGRVAGDMIATVSVLWGVKQNNITLPRIRFSTFPTLIKKFKAFPLYNLPNVLAHAAASSVPALIVTYSYGADAAGFYGIAFRVIFLPLGLLNMSVYRIFYERFNRLKSNKLDFRNKFVLTFLILSVIGILPSLILWWFGPEMVSWFLGAKWELSGILVSAMAVIFLSSSISGPLLFVAPLFERQKLFLVIEMASLFLRLSALIVASWYGDLVFAISMYAWMSAATMLMSIVACFYVVFGDRNFEKAYTS